MRPLYLSALAAGAVAVTAYWLTQPSAIDVRSGVALVAWLASLGATVWAARQDQPGTLKCVAGDWTWEVRGLSTRGIMIVMVDLQRVLVVAFTADDGRKFWHCLHRRVNPVAWSALRRALVSTCGRRARSAGGANGETFP